MLTAHASAAPLAGGFGDAARAFVGREAASSGGGAGEAVTLTLLAVLLLPVLLLTFLTAGRLPSSTAEESSLQEMGNLRLDLLNGFESAGFDPDSSTMSLLLPILLFRVNYS